MSVITDGPRDYWVHGSDFKIALKLATASPQVGSAIAINVTAYAFNLSTGNYSNFTLTCSVPSAASWMSFSTQSSNVGTLQPVDPGELNVLSCAFNVENTNYPTYPSCINLSISYTDSNGNGPSSPTTYLIGFPAVNTWQALTPIPPA